MSHKLGYSGVQFLTWFIANILGFCALGVSILVFPAILGRSGFFTTTFIIAVPISLAQWLALRRILPTSILWVLTIPVGVPLSFLVSRLIPAGLWFEADDDSLIAMTSMLFVVGLVIGLLQWIILRGQLLRAGMWILGSAFAVAGGFWLIFVTGLINRSGVLSYMIVVLVYSGVTGLSLSGLLAYKHRSQPTLANAT
jgi:hypothetical protein